MKKIKTIAGITQQNVEQIADMENASINRRTWGEMIADVVAKWVGSWTFLSIQSVLLIVWLMLNIAGPKSWDPYPFVLLNLILSFQAAYATPIILMSENRQARLSEHRNQLDLQINLLAEQENTEQLKLLRLISERLGIPLIKSDERIYEEVVKPDVIIKQIIQKTKAD